VKEFTNKVTRYIIDDLTLDIQRGELYRATNVIALPKLSYDLLLALAESSPALLSQAELMQKVWPERVIGDETLKQRVKLLRKTLGDNASSPKYIEAVRGRGYRLLPEVTCECIIKRPPAVMLDLTANDLFPNLSVKHFPRIWQKLSFVGFALLIMLMVSIIMSRFFYPLPTSLEKAKTALNQQQGSAVNEAATYLPKTKAEKYYQKGKEYYQRYRAQDNEIAIDFFNKAINELASFSDAYAGLSQAYSQKYFQFKGDEQDKKQAIDNAYLAITYGGDSVEAFKALGNAYYVSGWLSRSINVHLRAFEKDKSNAEVATNLGFIYSEQGNFKLALDWHKKAYQLDGSYPVAALHTAITLQRIGAFDLAEKWFEKTLNLQPDYMLAIYHRAQSLIEQEQYQRAQTVLTSALNRYPQQVLLLEALADCYYFQGQLIEAQKQYRALSLLSTYNQINRAYVLSLILDNEPLNKKENDAKITEATNHLKSLLAAGYEKPQTSFLLAQIYAFQQETQHALRYIVQAIEQGHKNYFQFSHAIEFSYLIQNKIIQSKLLLIQNEKQALRYQLSNELNWFALQND